MAPNTPEQSGEFVVPVGGSMDAWSPPETVENAHDQSAETNRPYPKDKPNTNRV